MSTQIEYPCSKCHNARKNGIPKNIILCKGCEEWKKYVFQDIKDAEYNRALILGKERAYTLWKEGADE